MHKCWGSRWHIIIIQRNENQDNAVLLQTEEKTWENCDTNAVKRWVHSLDCFFCALFHASVLWTVIVRLVKQSAAIQRTQVQKQMRTLQCVSYPRSCSSHSLLCRRSSATGKWRSYELTSCFYAVLSHSKKQEEVYVKRVCIKNEDAVVVF
jgi:hypothetical protein